MFAWLFFDFFRFLKHLFSLPDVCSIKAAWNTESQVDIHAIKCTYIKANIYSFIILISNIYIYIYIYIYINYELCYNVYEGGLLYFIFSQVLNISIYPLWIKIRGAFNKFPDLFVQVFKIVVDSWKFTMLLLYILWTDLWFQVQMNSYRGNWNTSY